MKTIFITSFHPLISRNILLNNGFFNTLLADNQIRLVIFCPDYKQSYFERNFKENNVIIEGVKSERIDRQDVLFSYLSRFLISTETLFIHRRELLRKHKKFLAFAFAYFLVAIGRWAFIKKLIRWLDWLTISKDRFKDYFNKYKPSLVLATDLFHVDDVHFLAEAKQKGIIALGMVRSWDNITGKGLFRVKPDKILVSNHIIKEEVIKYEAVSNQIIEIVGLAQMDFYINQPIYVSREEFFKAINLDPRKKTILFAPAGKRFYDADWYVVEILKKLLEQELPQAQVLIRCPPNDDVLLGDIKDDKNFAVDRPGVQFKSGVFRDQELDREDINRLTDMLYNIDVVIGYTSTLCIEAAFFNKPIITIAFDDQPNKSYFASSRRFLDFSHVRKFNKTHCAKIARSHKELKDYLKLYLSHPEFDQDSRKQLVAEQGYKLDGKTGERLALILKSAIANL